MTAQDKYKMTGSTSLLPMFDLSQHQMVNSDGDFSAFYRIQRYNGQLVATRLDPHWKPTKRCEIIIKNLPMDILLQEIFEFVRAFEPIHSIRLLLEFSGYCRGYCFVTFYNPELTKRACFTLNRHQIRSNLVFISISVDNCFLELMNVPGVYNPNELKDKLPLIVRHGLYQIVKTRKPGHFILEYHTHQLAIEARRFISPKFNLDGVEVLADWMTPKRNRRIYFQYLPGNVRQIDIYNEITRYLPSDCIWDIFTFQDEKGYILLSPKADLAMAFDILRQKKIFGKDLGFSLSPTERFLGNS